MRLLLASQGQEPEWGCWMQQLRPSLIINTFDQRFKGIITCRECLWPFFFFFTYCGCLGYDQLIYFPKYTFHSPMYVYMVSCLNRTKKFCAPSQSVDSSYKYHLKLGCFRSTYALCYLTEFTLTWDAITLTNTKGQIWRIVGWILKYCKIWGAIYVFY